MLVYTIKRVGKIFQHLEKFYLDVIIPSIPLPLDILDRSTPFSEATFFAAGLANARSPV